MRTLAIVLRNIQGRELPLCQISWQWDSFVNDGWEKRNLANK